jgi:hypothetical protein
MFNLFVIIVTFFLGAEVAKIVAKFDAEKIQEIESVNKKLEKNDAQK